MKKKLVIVGGANGVGKTTFAYQYKEEFGIDYLGADSIAEELRNKVSGNIDVIAGKEPEKIALRYKGIDIDTVLEIAKKYKDIDNWGIDDYIPNVEAGRFKILANTVGTDGKHYKKLVGVGLTEGDAARKAVRYIENNPGAGDLYIDTDFRGVYDEMTSVTGKQYGAMIGSLSKKLQESIDGINKKIADQMAQKTIAKKFRIVPTNPFSEFLLEKKDILQGEENIFPVLYTYAHSIEKKMALDPVIARIRKDMPKMTPEERAWIIPYIDSVKGKYGVMDRSVDALLGSYKGYSRFIGGVRTGEAWMKLGYRPVAASVNFASGQLHTMIKVGAPIYGKAWSFIKTPEGQQFIRSIEPYLGTSLVEVGTTIKSKTPMLSPLGMFQGPEPINREICAAANYLKALDDGKSVEAAREYAIRANMVQQFTYNVASLPTAMRGPTGKMILQFKPYLIKELEFMGTLTKGEWLGYLGMQLALGGPRGYIMVARTLPILSLLPFFGSLMDDVEEWMNKHAPIASRGVGALPGLIKPEYGADISGAASFQFPDDWSGLVGPALSDLWKLSKDTLAPAIKAFPEKPYAEDLKKAGSVIPIFRHYNEMWKVYNAEDNILRDDKNQKIMTVPAITPFILQKLAGVDSIDLNRIKSEAAIENRRTETSNFHKSRLANEFIDKVINNEPITEEFNQKLNRYEVNPSHFRERIRKLDLSPAERQMLRAEISRRYGILENEMLPSDFDLAPQAQTQTQTQMQ